MSLESKIRELVRAARLGQNTCEGCGALLNAWSRDDSTMRWTCKGCAVPGATVAEKDKVTS